jgi:hypothetical protein
MTFAAGWVLAGLVLLAPLVILHLRQRSRHVREVPSLLLWHEFELGALGGGRRLRPPPLPLLLALQALALILLVVALAEPLLDGAQARPVTVVVLDDSFWMTAPGALANAKREADGAIGSVPSGSAVRVVLADGTPSVLYRGSASGARAAIGRLQAGNAAPDLSRGLTVAAGLLTGPRDHVVLVRAARDPMPAVRASSGELSTLVAGPSTPDVGIFGPAARCGIGAPSRCEVTATVTNTGSAATQVQVIATPQGQASLTLSARVGAHASTQVGFLSTPGAQVKLSLSGSDGVAIDDQAWVTVPGDDNIPRAAVVTVVGTPADARSLAQAFAAVPGVTLKLETPSGYNAATARSSDLVVLDGALPHGELPPAPAVMLIDPSRLPGGHVGGAQADPTPSGSDPASPLLTSADLSSLTVNGAAARRLTLPRGLARVLWSPSGPLLAAGDAGRGRLIVTAFQPGGSTLAQLGAFPVLAANIVRWSLGWTSGTEVAGAPISVDALPGAQVATLRHDGTSVDRVDLGTHVSVLTAAAPGVYTVAESGPGVSHQASIDVNVGAPAPSPTAATDLRTAPLRAARTPRTPLAPWLLIAALIVLAAEWAYWSVGRTRVAV